MIFRLLLPQILSLKLAAIDIGSNAIRLQITNVIESEQGNYFKKLEYIRFPLRLGNDVFSKGTISKPVADKFTELMRAFKILIDLYEVKDYMAIATSAMREAENSSDIIDRVKQECDLNIEIIPGEKEAQMIDDALSDHLEDENHIHIDVGGGSTEINLFENRKKTNSASFRLGSVRRLKGMDTVEEWKEIETWVKENTSLKKTYIAIGTGGNIGKFYELSEKKEGKSLKLQQIEAIQTYINGLSLEERQIQLHLNPDRADVIIPASEIYIAIMKWAKAEKIIVPQVGLKDGVMKLLYEKHLSE